MPQNSAAFPLTFLRLRFDCRAVTDLDLGGLRAGMRLRGALLNVMNRSICALSPFPPAERLRIDPQHVENCPVCWLQLYEPRAGQARRAFALQPPLHTPARLPADARFTFAVTLFGEGERYLPYFVLAVREMGEAGVGKGRGRFEVLEAAAEHPHAERSVSVWSKNQPVLRLPEQSLTHEDVSGMVRTRIVAPPNGGDGLLKITFPTPLRVVFEDRLLKTPRFEAVFDALLKRLDELADLYAGGYQRPYDQRVHLRQLAREVEMVENHTEWVELSSSSSRTSRETWISGLVGWAVYRAAAQVWEELLEWLAWAEAAQVGKDTVKGNGVIRLGQAE